MSTTKPSGLPAPHVSSNVKRVLSISSIVSVLLILSSHVISRDASAESSTWQYLLQFVLISYSITKYLMYHAILYKLHKIFLDSTMPFMRRSVYSRTTLLLFSCALPLSIAILTRYIDFTFNQDVINAINTLSIVLVVIITLSMSIPCISRLWRLHVGQSNDILMAQTRSSSKAHAQSHDSHPHHADDASIHFAAIKLRAVLNDKELKQIQCTNRVTNLVVWGTLISLSTDLVTMFVVIDDILFILGIYIVSTFIMSFCVYLMLEFSSTEYYRCCSCCDFTWSRCCTVASKRAITQSMMRELFWMLNGETSNEMRLTKKRYEDMNVAANGNEIKESKRSEEAAGRRLVTEHIAIDHEVTSVPSGDIDIEEEDDEEMEGSPRGKIVRIQVSSQHPSNSTFPTIPLKSPSSWRRPHSNFQGIAVDHHDVESECKGEVMEWTSPLATSHLTPNGIILQQWYNGEYLGTHDSDAVESLDINDDALGSVVVEMQEREPVSHTVIMSPAPVSPISVPYTPQSTRL